MNRFVHILFTLLSCLTCAEGSAELRKLNILKFGNTDQDYILYKPDMSPLESEFTACAWIRRLNSGSRPVWFSYSSSLTIKEIQITDDGYDFRFFGTQSDLRSVYNVSPGTWFLNCLSWSSAAQTRNVYINGRVVDAASTPAGRTLGQGGYLLFGNEQDGLGIGMDISEIFGGEMYKLNVFSRMLTTSEIEEMSRNMCANVEEKYGSTRYIKWEDVIQLSRNGNIYEKDSGCGSEGKTVYSLILEQTELKLSETLAQLKSNENLLNSTTVKLERSESTLNRTQNELATTKSKLDKKSENLNKTLAELTNTLVTLNETIMQKEQGKTELANTQLELANTKETLNETLAEMEEGKLALAKTQETLNETIAEMEKGKLKLATTQETLNETLAEMEEGKLELTKTQETLNETLADMEEGRLKLAKTQETLNETLADMEEGKLKLATTQETLNETLAEMEEGKLELTKTQETLNETLADMEEGRLKLAKTQETLNETLADMEEGKLKLTKTQETLNETLAEKEASESELAKTQGALNETLIDVETKNSELRRTKKKLTDTETELNSTLAKVEELEEIANNVPDCALNSTITSQLDFLYSDIFYQHKLTADKLDVVRNILDKLGKS